MQIAKCLKTHLGKFPNRKMYLFAYEGNLTAKTFQKLMTHLQDAVIKQGGPNLSDSHLSDWLGSEWHTGREKNVTVRRNRHGNIDVSGEGWSSGNYNESEVVVYGVNGEIVALPSFEPETTVTEINEVA